MDSLADESLLSFLDRSEDSPVATKLPAGQSPPSISTPTPSRPATSSPECSASSTGKQPQPRVLFKEAAGTSESLKPTQGEGDPNPFHRTMTSKSDLSVARTPTKEDIAHMQADIAKAKAAVAEEVTAGKRKRKTDGEHHLAKVTAEQYWISGSVREASGFLC